MVWLKHQLTALLNIDLLCLCVCVRERRGEVMPPRTVVEVNDVTDFRTVIAMLSATTSIAVLATLNERPTLENIVSWLDIETL